MKGDSFSVSVDVSYVSSLYAYDFYVGYNQTSLSSIGTGCERGTMFGSMPHYVVACSFNNTIGEAHVAESLLGNVSVTGSGHLLNLNFTVNANAAGASLLHVNRDTLVDRNFANISHSTIDGIFYVHLLPVALYRVNPQGTEKQSLAGRTLVFNGSSSYDADSAYDPNGPIPLSCVWSFGDSTPTATGCVTTHAYNNPGSYRVMLNVTDNEGSKVGAQSTISVFKNPDFDGDGCVAIGDLARVAFRFGTRVGDPLYNVQYDVNNDGSIDIVDVVYVASYYGSCGFPVLDFTLASNSTQIGLVQGSSASASLTLTSVNGFSGTVSLALTVSPNLPSGPSIALNATTISLQPGGSGNAILALNASNSTTVGAYNITVTASTPLRSHTVSIILQVGRPVSLNLEMYTFNNSTSSALYLRNAGNETITLVTYYVSNNANGQYSRISWTGPSIARNALATTIIDIGTSCGTCTLQGNAFTFVSGASYIVTLVTSGNSRFSFTITRGGPPIPRPPQGESINLEAFNFATNNTVVTVNLRNTGIASISFVTYYVQDSSGNTYALSTWAGPSIAPSAVNPTSIQINNSCGSCTLSGTAFTFTRGYTYSIFLVTARNNEFVLTIPSTPPAPVGESLTLANYTFMNSTSVQLGIHNNGNSSITFVTYYVRDSNSDQYSRTSWTGPTIATNVTGTIFINIGASCGSCTNQGSAFTFVAGNAYTVEVVTSRNNVFLFTITR
jgi:hypothetical protein